jgi:hypothetical protein
VDWHRAVQVFPPGITRERHVKPHGLDLNGEGGIGPCLVLWRSTCLSWLSPMNGDPCSTHILTRHYGAQSQIVSQLESLDTTPTSKSTQFNPSESSKHLRTGSMRTSHHILTTRTETRGYIKLSVHNQAVHM